MPDRTFYRCVDIIEQTDISTGVSGLSNTNEFEQILVRRLPLGTKQALRDLARSHGRSSVEDELRHIIAEATGGRDETPGGPLIDFIYSAQDFRRERGGFEFESSTAPRRDEDLFA